MGLFGGGNSSSTTQNFNTTNQTDNRKVTSGGSGGINVLDATGGVTVNTSDLGAIHEAFNFATAGQAGLFDTVKSALDFSKAAAVEATGFAQATQQQQQIAGSSNVTVLYAVIAMAAVIGLAAFKGR